MSPPNKAGGTAGRFRLWVVRPAIWLLVLLTLAAAGLWVLVQSDFLRARVRTLVEAQLQDLLSRPVRIGSVAVTLAPLAVEARDVVIPGARPGDRDFAVVPRLLIEGDLTGMRKPHLHLRTIEIDNPQIFLERFPDGSDNVPRPPKRPPRSGEARFQLSIDSLTVRDGAFVMAERMLPMDLDARSVQVEAVGLGGWKLAGQIVGPEVTVGLPNAEPYPVSVAAKVRFERGHIQIETARIAGLHVQAHGEGDVYWGARREMALRIDGDVHSDLLVRMGYITDQVQGAARFAGRVDWTPERWSYQAGVDADALRVFERDLTAVHGVVDGGPGEIVTRIDQAEYRGGKVQGTVRVDMSSRQRPTRIDLEVDGADAAGALADQKIPVTAVAGAVRGVVSYRFNFKQAALGNGEIELQVLPREAPGRLPISGTVPLRLEKGVLRTDSLRVDAPGQHLTASGTVDVESGRGRFDFSLETSDPGRLALLLPPVEGPRLWWPSAGSGVISGTLELGQGGTFADLALALENVRSPGASGDLLEGALRVSERAVEDLELRLRQGGATLTVSGDVPLGSGAGAEGLAIAVRASEWPLGDVRAWLPEEVAAFPLDGRFTGAVDLSGSTETPAGSVDGTLRDTRWGELGLGELRAAFSFDDAAVTLARAQLSLPAGEVLAAGRIGLDDRPLDIAISAPGLRLDQPPFADLLGSELSGELAVEAHLAGTVTRPRGEATLHQQALALNGRPLSPNGGDASADMRLDWDGTNLEADGSLFGLVAVDGGGAFDLDHADLRFVVASDQIPTLADLVAEAPLPEFTGAFTGEAVVRGRFDESVRMAARLDRLELGFRGHTLTNIEPVEARLDGNGVAIDSLYLGEGGASEFFLAGRVGFADEPVLDLKIQATLPSSWLELVAPTLRATGSFGALATVRGTAARPEINGEGGVRDARLIVLGFPHAFEELRAAVLFYPDFVVLDELSSRLGGGTLQATGRVDFPAGRPLTYRFQATARDVTLRYPEGWLVRGGGEVTLTSTEGGRQVGGALELDRAYYLRDIPIGFSQLLRSLLARQRLQVAETDEVLASTSLNLGLRIPGTLRVRNNLANLRGEADLVVRGTLASPVVFGRVEMERGGTVVYAENEYKVERAILSFANPYRIEPVVDLVAKTEVSSYQVTLNLSGPFDRLRATFASDPPIPDLEVLSLLATGEPATFARELTPDAEAGASQGAEAFLAGQAANLIGQRVGTLFGLDKFRVAPLAAGGDAVSSVRVTAGKRLRRNLLLTYSVDPSATQDQFLTVEWRLNTNLALLFTQNGDGSYAVDTKWEKAF